MSAHLVWMDLEFSGLEPEKDVILEIATLITDNQLNLVAEGPVIAIHQPPNVLDHLDDWNRKHHTASGLLDRVIQSGDDHESADRKTAAFILEHCKPGESPLCGNSIHQDRRFLYKYMPRVTASLHYRNVDVSTLKELVKRWYPNLKPYEKKGSHRALDDILESIEELKYYRKNVFTN